MQRVGSVVWVRVLVAVVLKTLLCAVLAGCSGSGDGGPDDGALAPDGAEAAELVTPPDIPWLDIGVPRVDAPVLTPCPDGWSEVSDEADVTTCEPYTAGRLDCPMGQAHFPGEPGCAPVGSPCPVGPFAEDLPVDRQVVHIRPGATAGDGTVARPFGSVMEVALGSLPTDSVVALSRGTHTGPLRLSRRHVFRGACAEATIVQTTLPHTAEGVITLSSPGGTVRDLTVADSPRPGIWVRGSRVEARVDGVVVARTRGSAVHALVGARLDAENVLLRETRADSSGALGRALVVDTAATLDVRRALVLHNRDVAVSALATGSGLTLFDAVIEGTMSRAADGATGRGLSIVTGASATLESVQLSDNRDNCVFAASPNTTLTLTDIVVRATRSRSSDGQEGTGVQIQGGASARISRIHVIENQHYGVSVLEPDSTLALDHAVVRDTESRASDGLFGRGLGVEFAATTQVGRSLFSNNREAGVLLAGPTLGATLTDVVIRDTRGRASDGAFGYGLKAQTGPAVELSRILLANNRGFGVSASGEGTRLSSSDIAIRDTSSAEIDGRFGRGLNVQGGASAEVTRLHASNNQDLGVLVVSEGTNLTMSDVVVRETESQTVDGWFGRGFGVQGGATADVVRARFDGNRDLGVAVLAATASLQDVRVSDTRPRACVDTTCPDAGAGHGVACIAEGSLQMTRFSVSGSAICGLQLARDGEMDLVSGEIRRQPIGACVQVDGYDIDRLTTDVRFEDNDVSLQATTLPLPDTAAPLPDEM